MFTGTKTYAITINLSQNLQTTNVQRKPFQRSFRRWLRFTWIKNDLEREADVSTRDLTLSGGRSAFSTPSIVTKCFDTNALMFL